MKKSMLLAGVLVLVLASAAPAAAHVTIQPPESTTGAFARFVVRVPNEHDTAATIKVEVQMPVEFAEVRFQPKEGWRRTVNGRTVTWEGGRIAPGEFDEFGFSTRMPDAAGTLAFPAVQTYDNGEVVSWTGPADADKPAGRVTVKQAAASETDSHGATSGSDDAAAADDGADGDDDGADGADGADLRTWIAIALAGVALLVSLLAMARGRRT